MKYLNFNTVNGLYITIILEILWELFENTPYIINKYRKKKEFKNYKGDILSKIKTALFVLASFPTWSKCVLNTQNFFLVSLC